MSKPILCETDGLAGRAISTIPGATCTRDAPKAVIKPCLAKLAWMRAWNAGTIGARSFNAQDPRLERSLVSAFAAVLR